MSMNSKPEQPPDSVMQQLKGVYRLLARDQREAEEYARCSWGEEEEMDFFLGCCDFRMRRAVVLAVEAVRVLNGGMPGFSLGTDLLRLALHEGERAMRNEVSILPSAK